MSGAFLYGGTASAHTACRQSVAETFRKSPVQRDAKIFFGVFRKLRCLPVPGYPNRSTGDRRKNADDGFWGALKFLARRGGVQSCGLSQQKLFRRLWRKETWIFYNINSFNKLLLVTGRRTSCFSVETVSNDARRSKFVSKDFSS